MHTTQSDNGVVQKKNTNISPQKLNELENEIKLIFEIRISNQFTHRLEFDNLYNPNGIISVIPL